MKTKVAVLTAVLSLALAPASLAAPSTGKAGAPGHSCKSLNVKGKKTAAQRADRKACIKAAIAARKASRTPDETTPEEPPTSSV
jgi:hypothetical protein